MVSLKSLLLATGLAMRANAAATISIAVGNGGLVFTPSSVTAAVGDILEFSFYPRNVCYYGEHCSLFGDS
jgi:plastocyanin